MKVRVTRENPRITFFALQLWTKGVRSGESVTTIGNWEQWPTSGNLTLLWLIDADWDKKKGGETEFSIGDRDLRCLEKGLFCSCSFCDQRTKNRLVETKLGLVALQTRPFCCVKLQVRMVLSFSPDHKNLRKGMTVLATHFAGKRWNMG